MKWSIRAWTILNESQKYCQCTCQPDGHNSVLQLTKVGLECSLELTPFIDLVQVVGIPDDKYSDDLGFVHSIE